MVSVFHAAVAMSECRNMHVAIYLLSLETAVDSTRRTVLDEFLGLWETVACIRAFEPLPASSAILYNASKRALLLLPDLVVLFRIEHGAILVYAIAQLQPVANGVPYVYIEVMAGHCDRKIDVELHFCLCGRIYTELIFVVSV